MRKGQFLSDRKCFKTFDISHTGWGRVNFYHRSQKTTGNIVLQNFWTNSDEKNFCHDQMVNSRKNRWLALPPQDAKILMKTKHSMYIKVFRVVTNDSDIMAPFIFLYGLRLNMEACIKCLEEVVLPWIKRIAAGRHYVLQQDSVLCPTCKRTQCWLWENFCNHINA